MRMFSFIAGRAAWYIACASHAHLIGKDGSVITCKSPSPAFRGSSIYTQRRRSLTSYAISHSLSHAIRLRLWARIAQLVSELWLCVLNAASFENRRWRFTASHRTVLTDEMRITIACKISCSPNSRSLNSSNTTLTMDLHPHASASALRREG